MDSPAEPDSNASAGRDSQKETQAQEAKAANVNVNASRDRPAQKPPPPLAGPPGAPIQPSPKRTDEDAVPSSFVLGGAVITVALGLAVWMLFGFKPPPRANVYLRTEPPGAVILFNHGKVRLVSPTKLPSVPKGRYTIELSADGYVPLTGHVDIPDTGDTKLFQRLDPLSKGATAQGDGQ
jgi:hypothetical protein